MDYSPSDSVPANAGAILIFAPTGNDASMTASFLFKEGKSVKVCQSMDEICRDAQQGCDLIMLAEETLNLPSVKQIREMLAHQAPWSDIPIAVITSGGEASQERLRILDSLGSMANVGLLERPFRRGTLLSTVQVALRSRSRQYQVRDLLAERDQARATLEGIVQERTAELRETNSQLETLVYSIAHDLRAPLRSMQAFAKILMEDYGPKLDEEAVHYCQRIAKSAETMDYLVLDLLTYGRIARSEMELESVSVEEAWHAALDQFEHDIHDRHAVITSVLPLPRVYAHTATLNQILANLLGNALKFVDDGVVPAITFKATEIDDYVRITIEDNGTGIPPEYHEKIFRVFERLHRDKREGTGIGLAIVRKGAERMGGKVGLESGPSRIGSLFWIELKKAPDHS
jgi:signal transduction histidine kinase